MKNLVILTGAGMSAESGISTFRDAGGLWDKYPVEQVATPEGYAVNPKLVTEFYNERRKQLLDVKPNRGHELVAELEKHLDCVGKILISKTGSSISITVWSTIRSVIPEPLCRRYRSRRQKLVFERSQCLTRYMMLS